MRTGGFQSHFNIKWLPNEPFKVSIKDVKLSCKTTELENGIINCLNMGKLKSRRPVVNILQTFARYYRVHAVKQRAKPHCGQDQASKSKKLRQCMYYRLMGFEVLIEQVSCDSQSIPSFKQGFMNLCGQNPLALAKMM